MVELEEGSWDTCQVAFEREINVHVRMIFGKTTLGFVGNKVGWVHVQHSSCIKKYMFMYNLVLVTCMVGGNVEPWMCDEKGIGCMEVEKCVAMVFGGPTRDPL